MRPHCLLPTLAGITRLQRWHRAEQMGLEPPPEVYQVLQTHPGDPRFQFRSETGQGGLSGEPESSPGTTSLLALGGGCPDLREKWMLAWESLLSKQESFTRCLAKEGRGCFNNSF